MYMPKLFESHDTALLLELMRAHAFATVIGIHDGAPEISHIPLLILDGGAAAGSESNGALRIQGHFAKQNPLARVAEAGGLLTCVFHGPHAYISPRVYQNAANVPTWNYAVVHAHGHAKTITGDAVLPHLRALVATYESSAPEPWVLEAAGGLAEKLVAGIVAFELVVEKLEGKLKLNQNRLPEDWRGVVKAFEASSNADERAVVELMKRITPGGR